MVIVPSSIFICLDFFPPPPPPKNNEDHETQIGLFKCNKKAPEIIDALRNWKGRGSLNAIETALTNTLGHVS